MNKIILTGPESTGKSTLATKCADKYNLTIVHEYAREYLNGLPMAYEIEDLHTIAHHQHILITEAASRHKIIICDTDLLTLIIWYEEKYNNIPVWIMKAWIQDNESMHFLCYPDIPWIKDPQREHPQDRKRLYGLYLNYLKKYKKPYVPVIGNFHEREEIVHNEMKIFFPNIH